MRSFPLSSLLLEVLEGDLSAQPVDAVVNAANNVLWMGAGVAVNSTAGSAQVGRVDAWVGAGACVCFALGTTGVFGICFGGPCAESKPENERTRSRSLKEWRMDCLLRRNPTLA